MEYRIHSLNRIGLLLVGVRLQGVSGLHHTKNAARSEWRRGIVPVFLGRKQELHFSLCARHLNQRHQRRQHTFFLQDTVNPAAGIINRLP